MDGSHPKRRARQHPTRFTRCRRLQALLRRPDAIERFTQELQSEDIGLARTDYAIGCAISRDWLLSHCRQLVLYQARRPSS